MGVLASCPYLSLTNAIWKYVQIQVNLQSIERQIMSHGMSLITTLGIILYPFKKRFQCSLPDYESVVFWVLFWRRRDLLLVLSLINGLNKISWQVFISYLHELWFYLLKNCPLPVYTYTYTSLYIYIYIHAHTCIHMHTYLCHVWSCRTNFTMCFW